MVITHKKHGTCKKHQKRSMFGKMKKAIDKVEDDIAHKVVHELKESKMCCRPKSHPKNCKCRATKRKIGKKR